MSKPLKLVPPRPASSLQKAVDDFMAHVAAAGGSPRTAEFYDAVVRRILLPWCAREKVSDLGQLDQRHLDRLNAHLLGLVSASTGKPLSRASVGSYLRGVRHFIRWAQQDGVVNTKLQVRVPKAPRTIKDTLSRQEIAALENSAATERDRLIVRILGDGGLRLNELTGLTPESLVDQGRLGQYIKVTGKGSRERLVPLTPAVFRRLRRFAERGRPADRISERIFVSQRRRPASGMYEGLDGRAVQQIIKAAARRAGIEKPVSPHLLRHSWVTNALREGMRPIDLAKAAGHSNLTMISQVYEHLAPVDTYRELMRVLVKEDE